MSKDIETPTADTAKINKMSDPGYKIHVDTRQEIDQAKDRKRPRPRNEETGEIIPVAIAALDGGDGEGIYVIPKQYVRIEVGGGVVKLTPKNARLAGAELIAAADALAPRRRGKGKKRGRKTSMGQSPTQLVVDGHVGPAWATSYSESRDKDGNLDALYWSMETVELPTADKATASVGVMRTDALSVTGRWAPGKAVAWTDGGTLQAEHLAALVGKLSEAQAILDADRVES